MLVNASVVLLLSSRSRYSSNHSNKYQMLHDYAHRYKDASSDNEVHAKGGNSMHTMVRAENSIAGLNNTRISHTWKGQTTKL